MDLNVFQCFRPVTIAKHPLAGAGLTPNYAGLTSDMKRQLFFWAPLACIATGALLFTSCSTISSRIESNQAAFSQLSPQDQALIRQGKIRGGMSEEAVYLAWGNPQQKAAGMVHNKPTETWVYTASTAAYGPYYGPGWYGGWGFSGRVAFVGRHGGHRVFAAYYDPFWDPFYYPFTPTIQYPVKTVSFQGGRVVAFQFLAPGY
jgi:hypothetical protein